MISNNRLILTREGYTIPHQNNEKILTGIDIHKITKDTCKQGPQYNIAGFMA
jgi:hypothetical protein